MTGNSHAEIWARAAVSAIPYVGGPVEIIYSGYRARAGGRVEEFLEPILRSFRDPEAVEERLSASSQLDTLFGRALRAAVESGLSEKRAALGRVLASAISDAAIVDRAGLLVDTLARVEAPHIRAMAEIRDAVSDLKAAGKWPARAVGAEHEILLEVAEVGQRYDDSVIRSLKNLGLVFAADTTDKWFTHDLTPYGYELLDFLSEPSNDVGS